MSTTSSTNRLAESVSKRRTFAIISHPDAGKTTLTEKLLLYGGAIHLAGTVKSKRGRQQGTTSDWMELEKQRGISVSTSVMQFTYQDHHINLLDTPGHNDFSEDTYRTLSAADCAVMLIDSVKGVEPQTIKLFQVCRMRQIPIITFINKMDRDGREPLELMDEIESVLGIPCSPINWPIGAGRSFYGILDRRSNELFHFQRSERGGGAGRATMHKEDISSPALKEAIGNNTHAQLEEELELLDAAGHPFDQEEFLRGQVTPLFFGSAITNFGVEPFLDRFIELAPAPKERSTSRGLLPADAPDFSAFVFKIQANMDPRHRDCIAFLRICSGRFERGIEVNHVRTGRKVSLNKPFQFFAQERSITEEAFSGDIIGLWDPGILRIGDSLCQGEPVEFEGIPRFSPEHFVRTRLLDHMKRKQLKKGLEQLSDEGAIQLFYDPLRMERDPILGAVGVLQFEVAQHRLKTEYGVNVAYEALPHQHARWVEGEGFDASRLESMWRCYCLLDVEDRPLLLFVNKWTMERCIQENPKLQFIAAIQPKRVSK